jgi:RNA polymerase sigma factor (sigma-70 family)
VSLLRLRSDEQLVTLFRSGNDDAFRVIHDRYRQRLFVYTRQMLGGAADDAEDALQDIFVRAYVGLRVNDRDLALRAWLYRIAHNRCIDQLRRPPQPVFEEMELVRPPVQDPAVKAEQRDALRRLVADVRRLPDPQRSALLMRELGGMAYVDLAGALDVSIPAVKSLLVRARVGLAQAAAARDMACASIRDDVILAHDRGVRLSGVARRHMRDCPGCRAFRTEVRGVSRQFAALAPTLGPLGLLANFLGIGGAGSAAATSGGGAAVGSGALAVGSSAAAGGGALASAGVLATGTGHVVTLLAAAVLTAGGAVEVQSAIAPAASPRAQHHHVARARLPAYARSPSVSIDRPGTPEIVIVPSAAASAPPSVAVVRPRHRSPMMRLLGLEQRSMPPAALAPVGITGSTSTPTLSAPIVVPAAPGRGTLSSAGSSTGPITAGNGNGAGTGSGTGTGSGNGIGSGSGTGIGTAGGPGTATGPTTPGLVPSGTTASTSSTGGTSSSTTISSVGNGTSPSSPSEPSSSTLQPVSESSGTSAAPGGSGDTTTIAPSGT